MSENPFLKIDQQIIGDIYTSTESMDNLRVLCDDFGSRFGGTHGERLAAEFIQNKLKEYGLTNVHMEPIPYLGWHRGEAKLTLLQPIEKAIDCIALPLCPRADIEGEIIDLGDGSPQDFATHADKIPGKIVMVNSKISPKGVKRWIHRKEKLGRSMMAGAIGFIFVNHYPGYGPATGGIGHNNQEALIPGISICYEDGAYLQRLIKQKGGATIQIKTTCKSEQMTSWNIVGDVKGTSNSGEIVMLGCHYDGHDISQGAQDPASGAVALLEAARSLAKYSHSLPATVRVALWGIEEIGLLGSKQYVQDHFAEMDHIRFYLNMDSAGAIPNKGININEWPILEEVFSKYRNEMALDFSIGQSVNAHSDHFPFLMAGVPTGGIERVDEERTGRGYGHTKYDTLDKIQILGLREAAALAARLALRIASERTWPAKRRTQSEIDQLFAAPEYQEENAFRQAINTHYENA